MGGGQLKKPSKPKFKRAFDSRVMARLKRLELSTSCVTGRRSNQLSYSPAKKRYITDFVLRRNSFFQFISFLAHMLNLFYARLLDYPFLAI